MLLVHAPRLRQVLLNLLGNAVKFTHRGSVGLRLLPAPAGGLRAEVADTGPGIPADKRGRLFREFERLGADDAAAEGAGLGLSTSARLARAMGGRMGHGDNPGGGSVFWLELPGAAEVEPGPAAGPVARRPEPAPPPARSLRVLVVDDVAMNHDIARSFLRAAGHDVACAGGGAEAVEAARAEDFDAVLMDVRMPGVDGLEAARRVRALPGARGRVPVVALTAQAFAEQVAQCRAAGMDGHLAKPFTQDALLEALARAVASRAERDGVEAAPEAPEAESEPPVFDPGAFERTAAFLPSEGVGAHLRTLAGRAEALLCLLREPDALTAGARGSAEAAHAFAGSAGMFGFARASAAARGFEHAVQAASPEAPASAESLTAALEASLGVLRRRAGAAAATGTGQEVCT